MWLDEGHLQVGPLGGYLQGGVGGKLVEDLLPNGEAQGG